MKQYIFMTANIYPIGGMQNYVAGKVRYLREKGWDVHVFFAGDREDTCALPILNDFVHEEIAEIYYLPGSWNSHIRKRVLDKMIQHTKKVKSVEEIVIESHSDVLALWGELLAERLSAKHMCFSCNEVFEGKGKFYKSYLDFFSFKHARKELLGIHANSLVNLFGDYKIVLPEERYVFYAAHEEAVQDIANSAVESVEKKDWNIGFLGRADKLYDQILDGIAQFCMKYKEKSIQFVMVGDAAHKEESIYFKLGNIPNLSIRLLGDQVPIPRAYFHIVDVVIAGSGCAECAAREGTPTIVADGNNGMANGVLGHTTFDILFSDISLQKDYLTTLEEVLVHRIHERTEFKMVSEESAWVHYDKHMTYIRNSEPKREYYVNLCVDTKKNYFKIVKYYIKLVFPFVSVIYLWIKRARNE